MSSMTPGVVAKLDADPAASLEVGAEAALTNALAHIAIAEAFTAIDGVELSDRSLALVREVGRRAQLLHDRLAPEVVELHAVSGPSKIIDLEAGQDGQHTSVPVEVDKTSSDVNPEYESPIQQANDSTSASPDQASDAIAHEDTTELVENNAQPAAPPTRITVSGRRATVDGISISRLGAEQARIIEQLVRAQGAFVSRADLGLNGSIATIIKPLNARLKDAGLDHDLFVHNGGSTSASKWALNPVFVDTERMGAAVDESRLHNPSESTSIPSATSSESLNTSDVTSEMITTPPSPAYDSSSYKNRRARRSTIINVQNLDEINNFTLKLFPYGDLPKITITDEGQGKSFELRGRTEGLSDDQRELLNILLANLGKPLTEAEIFAQDFCGHISSKRIRIESLTSAVNRFKGLVTSDGERMIVGDTMLGKGVQLNPKLLLVDGRAPADGEILKKK